MSDPHHSPETALTYCRIVEMRALMHCLCKRCLFSALSVVEYGRGLLWINIFIPLDAGYIGFAQFRVDKARTVCKLFELFILRRADPPVKRIRPVLHSGWSINTAVLFIIKVQSDIVFFRAVRTSNVNSTDLIMKAPKVRGCKFKFSVCSQASRPTKCVRRPSELLMLNHNEIQRQHWLSLC